jgi:hypothetical protein
MPKERSTNEIVRKLQNTMSDQEDDKEISKPPTQKIQQPKISKTKRPNPSKGKKFQKDN